jgi:arylsulfatase A-like enzyme
MKRLSLLLVICISGLSLLFNGCDLAEKNISEDLSAPNIIMVITDDQGYGDLSCHGNSILKTPHLDKLSAQSVRFTNFHVGTTCAPTRAGLMSGHHCNRVGAWHTVMGRSFLSTRFKAMPAYLKNEGYKTAMFGKWHLGDNFPFRPQDRGFDEVIVHGGGGVGQTPDYWNNDYFDDTYFHNGEPRRVNGYCTDIWFDEAIRFMENNSTSVQPFFCYISTNAPHGPHHAPQQYIDAYKGLDNVPNPNFYGQIANIDDNIGKLMEAMHKMNISENTIFFFLTDNGTAQGAQLDNTGQVTKGFNAGMRGKKGSEYEGGHRVPLFIRFPEKMKIQNEMYDELASYTDILPTILDMVNVKSKNVFDGTSIWPLIKSGRQDGLKNRILITDTQRNAFPVKWKNASVMQDHWRLINNQALYNLQTDPGQKDNIMESNPEIADRLFNAYEAWWDEIKSDFESENRIIIGSKFENPVLLTSHDWHTDKLPPWHQNHIREGVVNNGTWLTSIEQDGEYLIKLYRWPPYLDIPVLQGLSEGEVVPGGNPYPAGKGLNIIRAELEVQNLKSSSLTPVSKQYFEFQIKLNQGTADFHTKLVDKEGTERGAYYVEVELLGD